jgi:putative transcriptional regulator
MPTSRRSAPPSPKSGKPSVTAAHLRGELAPPLREYAATVPGTIDVAAVRGRFGLSQAAFARRFGLDVTALQAWEQGRRQPDRTARLLLMIIAREPEAVRRALAHR